MKKKRLTALILSIVLAVTGVATGISTNKVKAADYGLCNPRVDSEGNVTWDCAYFGSYYQTAQWEKEPIKWRVLSVDEDNNAFIVADKNLDCKRYNETYEEVHSRSTWADVINTYANVVREVLTEQLRSHVSNVVTAEIPDRELLAIWQDTLTEAVEDELSAEEGFEILCQRMNEWYGK